MRVYLTEREGDHDFRIKPCAIDRGKVALGIETHLIDSNRERPLREQVSDPSVVIGQSSGELDRSSSSIKFKELDRDPPSGDP